MVFKPRAASLAIGLAVAGCASKPAPVTVALAPSPPAAIAAMPAGASPDMIIPVKLADGSYPTPNRNLSTAAAIWHLRAGLNVAALACRGPEESAIIAGYNALLATQKAALANADATLTAEYRASGGADWRDRYDDSMTRLYNYFSQSPARMGFCVAARQVLADATAMPADGLASFAVTRIDTLDRPFTDFYRAYDAWRGTALVQRPVIALAATVAQPQRIRPRLELDPSVFVEN